MKVLHVIPSLSPEDGGPSFVMPLIAKALEHAGVEVHIATTEAAGEARPELDAPNVFYFHRQTEFYKTSLPLSRWLARNVREYDLVHIHALFSYASYAAARHALKNNVPYIVRPLGVLNRWGMENRRPLLKRWSFQMIERRILDNAAAIHYTSEQERREAGDTMSREQGAGSSEQRLEVIPLGIDLGRRSSVVGLRSAVPGGRSSVVGPRSAVGSAPLHQKFPVTAGRDVILFLSRLDCKKGLDLLLRAFAKVQSENDRRPATDTRQATTGERQRPLLVIGGSGEPQYVAELQNLAEQLGISGEILWAGFLDGEDKRSALAGASMFVLPSYSENFGIAVVEALAAGLACVVSDQVAVASDIERCEAGVVVPCEAESLAAAVMRLVEDAGLRMRLGGNARRLAEERFSIEAMADSLVNLYREILAERQDRGQPTTEDRRGTTDEGQPPISDF